MNSKLLFVFGLVLLAGLAMAKPDEFNEYEESQKDETETPEKEETANDDESKMVMEDMNTETSMALVENDPDSIKNKGLCHYGISAWFKPGAFVRCNCMKCTCKNGGNWACAYNFAYCPYFYCGNQIYNPSKQICCCGKVHPKKRYHACCGYFYYDARYSQCCNYFSVKPKKAKCPRYRI